VHVVTQTCCAASWRGQASPYESPTTAKLCSRDYSILLPGQRWEEALRQEVASTDCFVVLVSPNSAAEGSFVRREVEWALAEYTSGGLVTTILPIVVPGSGWDAFPKLHPFHRWDYPMRTLRPEFFDRLADGIAATRHGKGRPAP
jgi:TIR domain